MVRHYETAEEAYATRRELWEARQERERTRGDVTSPVKPVDRYLFDLQGFIVVKGAIGAEELAAMNEAVDAASTDGDKQLGLTPEEARVMMSDPHSPVGKDAQQGFGFSPGGGLGSHPCFDALINHPGYISHVKEFVNGEQTAFTAGGSVMQRWPGQASGIHGGGDRLPDWFSWDEEQDSFLCRAVNVVVALNDCGEHGGNTAVVPGSHKSNLQNPFQDDAEGHPQVLWYSQPEPEPRTGAGAGAGG